MIVFLTSSPCDNNVPEDLDLPCVFFRRNGFVTRLREAVAPDSRGLYITASPDAFDSNDEAADTFAGCFAEIGLPFRQMKVLDWRTLHEREQLIREADVIILGGGHVPTQNAFFEELRLREMLVCYSGVVMGISAGSMNAADVVYAQPEEPGEAVDPEYERFLRGLGLTDINLCPHYQMVKDDILDGLRLFEDITCADSEGHTFYAIPDGSYVLVDEDSEVLYGEGYRIRDGEMTQVCEEGGELDLTWL